VNRFSDALIGAAATDVRNGRIDVRITRLRIGSQQCRRGHDLTRLAVTALRHIVLQPGSLHRMADAIGDKPSMVVIFASPTEPAGT
jgi:hypothetical protein